MKVVLGWDIHFSIWVSSLTVALYVTLGGLLSAIFNEVLQFVLIWLGALLISDHRADRSRRLERAWSRAFTQNFPARITRTCGGPWDRSTTTRWASTGWALCSGWAA